MMRFSILVFLMFFLGCKEKEGSNLQKHPNVLFIVVDDLRPMLGCYGEEQIVSPNIDKLATQGYLFTRAYTQQAWCSPSRTSLLTGLRPDKTRVYDLVTHFRHTVPDAVTLPQYFKNYGYFATAFGKVFHEKMDDTLSWNIPAWEPDVDDPLKYYVLPENITLAKQKNGYAAPVECAEIDDEAYPDGQITSKAIDFLKEKREQPFFVAVGYYKPHLPFNAPKKYWDLYTEKDIVLPAIDNKPEGAPEYAFMHKAEHHNYIGIPFHPNGTPLPDSITKTLIHGYYACVSYIDSQVGRLLKTLEEMDQTENTIVVLWGDHGWKLGDYGSWSKHTNYDIDTRVPLIIVPAGDTTKPRQVKSIVETIDVYPALVEMAGLPPTTDIDGKSLVPLFSKNIDTNSVAFSQFIRNATMTHTTNKDAVTIGQTIRTDKYRLVRWLDKSSPTKILALELYDHAIDKHETINLANEVKYQEIIKELSLQMDNNFNPEK